jgi:hypothetical protein
MVSFKASFDTYDVDGDGAISPTELRKAMADHGMKLSETDSAVIFNRIDTDGDGSISKIISIKVHARLKCMFPYAFFFSLLSHSNHAPLLIQTYTSLPTRAPPLQTARSSKLSQTNSRSMSRTEQRRPWRKAVRPC